MSTETELAHHTQEKFHFYVLGLIFTLLAASVQTAEFGSSHVATALELLGWVSLLISGIALMWRVEWDSPIRMLMQKISEAEREEAQLIQLQLRGVPQVQTTSGAMIDVATRLAEIGPKLISAKERMARLDRLENWKYLTARSAFLTGLVALVVARGLPAAVAIFGFMLR